MTANTQKAYNESVNKIAEVGTKLSPGEWYDFLDDLTGHLKALMDCYREEHPEAE